MKSAFIILMTLFAWASASAQRVDSVVFKKARKVIIKNQHTAAENFKIAGTALIEKGYMIGNKDEQFNQLISEPIKTYEAAMVIYATVKDNEIDITAKYKHTSTLQLTGFIRNDPAYENVLYTKNDDWAIERFKVMTDFAKLIGGEKIIYTE
jgi:uncharacterized protein YpmS